MDEFQKTFLRAAVSEYDKLSELEKQTGLETRVLARLLSPALGIDESSVDSPEYQGSELFMKVLNTVRDLREAELLKDLGNGPVYWVTPTVDGRARVDQWAEEDRSPVFQGKRLLEYLYEHQQDEHEIARREGIVEGIDVGEVCETLGISRATYGRAVNWAIRHEYAGVGAKIDASIENGDIYITSEGMNAVEEGFQSQQAQLGTTINIHDNKVVGNILAAGRDAMTIISPEISANAAEIRQLLEEIQEAIDTLGEDDDDRHDALQELESVQREFLKKEPLRERIERSISVLGGLASISTLAGQHLTRLLELAQQLPGT